MRKIIPSPTSFASFTGSTEFIGEDDTSLSLNLAENVDLPAIFRTLDQGVVPGLILTAPPREMLICSGQTMTMANDTIAITFAPFKLFDILVSISVSLTTTDSGGTAIRIPGSELYLKASTQINK